MLLNLYEITPKFVHKKGPGTMTDIFFPKNSNCDLDLGPTIQDCNLVKDNVVLNICVKLYQNLSISDDKVFLNIATVTLTLDLFC